MSVLVTKQAPCFTSKAVMPNGTFADVSLKDYRGKYVLLFFYPMDFTFVCPTEIIAFSDREGDFQKQNTQILGCSVDSEYSHLAWINTPRTQGGIGKINYPLLADVNKSISKNYDVLFDDSVALRGLFLIDKEGIVRHQLVNDQPLGRSVDEAIRMVLALRFFEENGEVCPANWHSGDKAMKADPSGSKEYFQSQYK